MTITVPVLLQALLPLLAVAVMWGSLINKLSQMAADQKELKSTQSKQGEDIRKIELSLARDEGARAAEKQDTRPLPVQK